MLAVVYFNFNYSGHRDTRLETLFKTKSLSDEDLYNYLHAKLEILGKKINLFIRGVDNTEWIKPALTTTLASAGKPGNEATSNQ